MALDPDHDGDLLVMHGRRLIELDPTDIELRERLAEAYSAKGKVMPEVDQRAAIFMEAIRSRKTRDIAERQRARLHVIAPEAFETKLCDARWDESDRRSATALYASMVDELSGKKDSRSLARLAGILAETESTAHDLRVKAVCALLAADGLTDDALTLMRALQRDLTAAEDIDGQIALLNEAVEASHANQKFLSERADLYLMAGKKPEAAADYQAAAAAFARHDKNADALRLLQRAARVEPNRAAVQQALAEAAERTDDISVACTAWAKLLDILEKDGAPEETLLMPLMRLTELLPGEEKYHERLLKTYRDIGQDRQAAEMLVERALKLDRGGRSRDAEHDLTQALRADPDFVPARKAYAEFLVRHHRPHDARSEFLTLASQFDERGKVGAAIGALNSARELDPDDPVPYERLGEVYARQNNKERALNALYAASNRYLDRKEPVQAADILVRSMELSPDDARAPKQLFTIFFSLPEGERTTDLGMRLARVFLRSGDVKQATAILERLRQAPAHTWEFQVAVAELYKEFELRHQAHEIYLETAVHLVVEGKQDDALAVLNLAEQLGYNAIDVERTRTEILEQSGTDPEKMADAWRGLADLIRDSPDNGPEEELGYRTRLREARPDDEENIERIAEIHIACGDTTEAAEVYDELATRALESDRVDEGLRRLDQALQTDGAYTPALERRANHHATRGEVTSTSSRPTATRVNLTPRRDATTASASISMMAKTSSPSVGSFR